jgi:hypothetical protein
MSFIGLDIDHRNKFLVRFILNRIKEKYKPTSLRLFLSPTRKGYHIKFETNEEYDVPTLLKIRKELGDDPNRISMIDDNYRDVLFIMKSIKGVTFKAQEIDVELFFKYSEEVPI